MATEIVSIDEVWTQTKNLNFQDLGKKRGIKTHLYVVRTRKTGTRLGLVGWGWSENNYIFYPDPEYAIQAFNNEIVEDIASFCKWVTRVFRNAHPYKVATFKKRRARRIQNLLKKPDGGGLDKRYAPMVE